MAGYGTFSEYYDLLTGNVEYAAWATYLLELFERFSEKKPKVLLDLACGTGNLSAELLTRGVDVIGVDGSPEMLMQAAAKGLPFGERLMLLCQNMQELDLYGTVDGAVCMLDSLNHLTETADVRETFRRLGLFIEPDGLLIFDVNTPYKHAVVLGDNAFTYEQEDFFCAWQNRYFARNKTVEMTLDFFVQNGEGYERYTETVRERAYAVRTLRRLLAETGFEILAIYDERTFLPPSPDAQRVVFVAKNSAIQQER